MDPGNDKKREALYAVQILKYLGRINAIWITFQNYMFFYGYYTNYLLAFLCLDNYFLYLC